MTLSCFFSKYSNLLFLDILKHTQDMVKGEIKVKLLFQSLFQSDTFKHSSTKQKPKILTHLYLKLLKVIHTQH